MARYVPISYESMNAACSDGWGSPRTLAFFESREETRRCANDIMAGLVRCSGPGGLNTDFAEDLVGKYGIERVKFVLAAVIQSNARYGMYPEDTVKWAEGVRISDSFVENRCIIIPARPQWIDRLADRVREMDEKSRDMGADVIKKEERHMEDSEMSDEEKKFGVERREDGTVAVTMPDEAVIRRYVLSSVIVMPKIDGYEGFRYMIDTPDFTDNGDGTVTAVLGNNALGKMMLRRRREERVLTASELADVYEKATDADYRTTVYDMEIPKSAVFGNYPNVARILIPEGSEYGGKFTLIPKSFVSDGPEGGDTAVVSLPDYVNITIRMENDDALISAAEFSEIVKNGTYRKRTKWEGVALPREAVVQRLDRTTILKMPKGEYGGCRYALPNMMVKETSDGEEVSLRIPSDRKITLRDAGRADTEISAEKFIVLVKGKTAEDYPAGSGEDPDGEKKRRAPIDPPRPRAAVKVRDDGMSL